LAGSFDMSAGLDEALRHLADKLPDVRQLLDERDRLRLEVQALHAELESIRVERDASTAEAARYKTWVPPGHFYSPIVSIEEVRARHARSVAVDARTLPGVDLRDAAQLELLRDLARYYADIDFPETQRPSHRYYFQNPNYSYGDAIVLHSMIRHLRPARIVEIGSGFSSCVTLDTNERHFANSIRCTFVDPYPALLESLLKPGDRERVTILPSGVHDVDPRVFSELDRNDILFVDSTHVSKTSSDVNHLLFEVFPRLKHGVYVHVHDVFFPFEYPAEWIDEGRSWNECYILRAFLYANTLFSIEFFASFLARFYRDALHTYLPRSLENPGGNIWLRRTDPPDPAA
jgi:hypothetical protein